MLTNRQATNKQTQKQTLLTFVQIKTIHADEAVWTSTFTKCYDEDNIKITRYHKK